MTDKPFAFGIWDDVELALATMFPPDTVGGQSAEFRPADNSIGVGHSGPSEVGLFIAGFTSVASISSAEYGLSMGKSAARIVIVWIKPTGFIVTRKYHWHSVVNLGSQFIRAGRQDRCPEHLSLGSVSLAPHAGNFPQLPTTEGI